MSKHKVALVSGGTDGMGKSAVLQLLQDGFTVATFSRTPSKANALKKEIGEQYGSDRFLVLTGDVTKEGDVKKIVSAVIKKFKKIDVLVNNAGAGYFTDCDKVDVKAFKQMIDVNLVGVVLMVNAVVPHMKKKRTGLIINVSSTSGKHATPSQLYSATKFAVTGYSQSIREELRTHNIKVTTVYPGMVMTHFFEAANDWQHRLKDWQGVVPQMLEPEDIGRTIGFVCAQPEHVLIDDITVVPFRNK